MTDILTVLIFKWIIYHQFLLLLQYYEGKCRSVSWKMSRKTDMDFYSILRCNNFNIFHIRLMLVKSFTIPNLHILSKCFVAAIRWGNSFECAIIFSLVWYPTQVAFVSLFNIFINGHVVVFACTYIDEPIPYQTHS